MSGERPATVDAYLAAVEPAEFRQALCRVRRIIRDEFPEAEECLAWGMPSFRLGGILGSYAAFKRHCSFFPGAQVAEFAQELEGFKTSKGAIQFTPDKPIPEDLLRAIVRSRAEANRLKQRR